MKNLMIAAAVAAALSQLPAAPRWPPARTTWRRSASSFRDSCSASTSSSRKTRRSRPRTRAESAGRELKAQGDYLKAETQRPAQGRSATQSTDVGKVQGRGLGRRRSRSRATSAIATKRSATTPPERRAACRRLPIAIAIAFVRAWQRRQPRRPTTSLSASVSTTDRRRRSAFVGNQTLTGVFIAQADRSRPRLLRLEVRQLGQPDRRQDEAAVLQARRRACSGTTTSIRKALRSRSTAASGSAARTTSGSTKSPAPRTRRRPTR